MTEEQRKAINGVVRGALFDAFEWGEEGLCVDQEDIDHVTDRILFAITASGLVIVSRDEIIHALNIMPDTRVVQSVRAMIASTSREETDHG